MSIAIWQKLRMPIDHRWAGPRMSAYLDGELSPRASRRMEAHTRICPECHRVLRTLREMLAALRRLPATAQAPPPDATRVSEQVLARIRDQRGGG